MEPADPAFTQSVRPSVVTGASRGIGRANAEEFESEGADVVVNYRSSEATAEETAEAVGAPIDAVTARADVSDPDAVAATAEPAQAAFGPVDVLVDNAGMTIDRKFEHMASADSQQVTDADLGSVFDCTHVLSTTSVRQTTGA